MKVKECIEEWNRLIPFPWTPKRIEKCGYSNPTEVLLKIAKELSCCEDVYTCGPALAVIRAAKHLETKEGI